MMKKIKSNVPALRFQGYNEKWEEKKFGELFPITSAARVHKHEWRASGVPFFRSSDVISAFKGTKNTEVFISHELYLELSAKVGCIKKGDILVTGGGSIGIPYLVSSDEALYFKDADLLWFKIREAVDSHFLYTFFSSHPFKKYVKSISHIGTIAHYTIEQAKSTPLLLPMGSIEQTQIGEYFNELDQLIKLHQCKHDKLITLKQAMLQKMFPQEGAKTPEIRFRNFSTNWETRTLSDIMQPISNNTLSRAYLNYKSGPARNIHYGDILVKFCEVIDVVTDDLPFISDLRLIGNIASSKLEDGDIIIADAAEDSTVGKCTELLNVGDTLIFAGLHTIALRPSISFAPAYLGYFMNSNSFHDQLLPIMQGTKVLSVSKTALKDTIIYFPNSINEQQKIGTYFCKLDKLISQHATQLEKLKQIKSACLAKMFV